MFVTIIYTSILLLHTFQGKTLQWTVCPIWKWTLKQKLVKTIRADEETCHIEVNFKTAGVSEEQVFFTEDDDKTEAHIWNVKNKAITNLATPLIHIDVTRSIRKRS